MFTLNCFAIALLITIIGFSIIFAVWFIGIVKTRKLPVPFYVWMFLILGCAVPMIIGTARIITLCGS